MTRIFFVLASLLTVVLLAGCSGSSSMEPLQPGQAVERQLPTDADGYERSYRLYVPDSYQPGQEWPLVVAIHGAFSTARYHEERTGFSRVADEEGFIVLYPNGIGLFGYLQHWNAGHCCARALGREIDDIGFIFSAIEDAAALLSIDRRRIYVTGFSNGGMLTHYIGSQRADSVAAIAPVAGALGGSETPQGPVWHIPPPQRPLPVMLVHGTDDDRVPYNGGPRPDRPEQQQYLSVDDAADWWRQQNGCSEQSAQQSSYEGLLTSRIWTGCEEGAELVLWTLHGWRHTWPGPDDPTNEAEPDLHGLDLARSIWAFFREHQLPET